MSVENLLWGAPRIHGELLKLGNAVAQSTVAKYMTRTGDPSGQSWDTFVRNHAPHVAAMDLFVVPTICFNLLYVLVIVRLARRELVWINVTAHPTAEWIAQQITEAFPWNEVPRYLIRDRDEIYGAVVTRRVRAMGIRDKPISAGSPWQNCFAERLIGTIRRECVDHVVVLGEEHLRRVVKSYASYYNTVRTHRSLDKDAPVSRRVQRIGRIVSQALVGGLHHRYDLEEANFIRESSKVEVNSYSRRTRTARWTYSSGRRRRPGRTATGSTRRQVGRGARCSASTAPRSRCSTKRGDCRISKR
jgi:transposase InsO family protein